VPALWFWTRFNREKGESKGECKGYIKGGYKHITDTCARVLRSLGADIRLKTTVQGIDLDAEGRVTVTTGAGVETFDQLVVTLPTPQVEKLIGPAMRREMPALDTTTDYQGVINCLLFLEKPLTPHYWVATPESEHPFDGVVETSTLTDTADRGDRHVVYLTKYLHRGDARFAQDDANIRAAWIPALKKLFPQLQDDDIETSFIFRAPFVEPIYKLGQMQLRPPEELVANKVYMANTAQVYPVVTSWNGSVIQAERTLAVMGVSLEAPVGARTAELKLSKPNTSAQPLRPVVAKA
jgi:protoporphyrinogen oxidase